MQSPEDAAIWLQCLYLWAVMRFAPQLHALKAWRSRRVATAQRRRDLRLLEYWSIGPAFPRRNALVWPPAFFSADVRPAALRRDRQT